MFNAPLSSKNIFYEKDRKLKAFEIIKKTLGIDLYFDASIQKYCIAIGGLVVYPLKSKEEYDLLKEQLKN